MAEKERRRNNALNVRIDDHELRMLHAVAAHEGLDVSSWVRRTIRTAFWAAFPEPVPTTRKKTR